MYWPCSSKASSPKGSRYLAAPPPPAPLSRLLDRQRDAPPVEIDVDDLHPQLLAGGDDLLGRLDVVRGHLGDVHEAFDAFAHLHERPERHEFGHSPVHH